MPTYVITAPDGRKFRVSGQGSKQDALTAVQQKVAAPSMPDFNEANPGSDERPQLTAALQRRVAGGAPGSMIDPLAQGLTLGFGDEMLGGVGGLITAAKGQGFRKGYDALVDASRAALKEERANHPIRSTALEIVGSLPSAALPVGKVAQGASLGTRMLQGAKAGALLGGIYGAGAAEGGLWPRARGAAISGAVGGAVGAAVPAIGAGVGKVFGNRAGTAAVPTIDARKAAAQALYEQANQAGVTVAPQSLADSATDLIGKLNIAGIDKDIQPKAFAAAQKFIEAAGTGQPASLQDMDIFRQVANNIARDPMVGKNEQRIAGIIVSHIDDFMETLKPSDVLAGDPTTALPLISQARNLWKIKAKAEVIQTAMANAQNAASGVENGLRTEFRKLLKVGRYSWTAEERDAIERVVRGGFKENALRFFGTFGIPIDQGRNWLGAFAGGGAGGALGGPVGAVALPALGTAAKYGARAAAQGNASAALNTALAGGMRPFDAAAAARARIAAEQILRPILPAAGIVSLANAPRR